MDAKWIAEAVELQQTEARMQRVSLIVERSARSASHRRAPTAPECLVASDAQRPAPVREPIGFAYPTARGSAAMATDPAVPNPFPNFGP